MVDESLQIEVVSWNLQRETLCSIRGKVFIEDRLLAGGSAYGLAAADGVAAWLAERGRGFETGVGRVPIVPSAVIFDLGRGRSRRRPDAEMGRAACEATSTATVPEGRVGAGTGATVGKLLGVAGSMPGGIGSSATPLDASSARVRR